MRDQLGEGWEHAPLWTPRWLDPPGWSRQAACSQHSGWAGSSRLESHACRRSSGEIWWWQICGGERGTFGTRAGLALWGHTGKSVVQANECIRLRAHGAAVGRGGTLLCLSTGPLGEEGWRIGGLVPAHWRKENASLTGDFQTILTWASFPESSFAAGNPQGKKHQILFPFKSSLLIPSFSLSFTTIIIYCPICSPPVPQQSLQTYD